MTTLLELAAIHKMCPKEVYSDLVDGVLVKTTLVCEDGQLMLHRPHGTFWKEHLAGANRQLARLGLVAMVDDMGSVGLLIQPDGMRFRVIPIEAIK